MKDLTFRDAIKSSLPALKGFDKYREHEFLSPQSAEQIKNVAGIALGVIGAVGALAITIAIPNIWQVLPAAKRLRRAMRDRPKQAQAKIVNTFYYLRRQGYIRTYQGPLGELFVSLTRKGKQRYRKLYFESLTAPRAKVWNKHWWCVAADIPTKEHRQGADLLRNKLKSMGFCALQRTMWFYPFDPRSEINIITEAYDIGHFVTVLEACMIDAEDERVLRAHFRKLHVI